MQVSNYVYKDALIKGLFFDAAGVSAHVILSNSISTDKSN